MRRKSLDLLQLAIAVMEEYRAQGLTLTLRQLYYQLVARGYIASGDKSYKRLGNVLSNARFDGTFPIDGLVDRGREVSPGDFLYFEMVPEHALEGAARWMPVLPSFFTGLARWAYQPAHVSVWVEKEALAGVFAPICDELGVSWFACKGYPSVSALWEWIGHARQAHDHECRDKDYAFRRSQLKWVQCEVGHAERSVILYFGDHDPDGWEIPRSAERNLRRLLKLHQIELPFEVRRVALNRDQIDTYQPPPFDAKESSARFNAYVREHDTEDAWELDALEPRVLRDLIRTHVAEHFDEAIHRRNEAEVAELRERMRDAMREPGWLEQALRGP